LRRGPRQNIPQASQQQFGAAVDIGFAQKPLLYLHSQVQRISDDIRQHP
jgi:hypothetical protein